MSERVQDYTLIIGHVWRCSNCRDALLKDPETTWVGFKLSEDQRERILQLDDESFQTVVRLTQVTGLSQRELETAIEHPRARLRHLGNSRRDYYFRNNGS